jgi:hypothetical protein
MDAVADQEAEELWSAVEPHRREYHDTASRCRRRRLRAVPRQRPCSAPSHRGHNLFLPRRDPHEPDGEPLDQAASFFLLQLACDAGLRAVLLVSDAPRTLVTMDGLAMVGTKHALKVFDVLCVSHDPIDQDFFALSCTVRRHHLVCLCWPALEPCSSLFSPGSPKLWMACRRCKFWHAYDLLDACA